MRSESVATPVPKKQKKARMKNASGESFKNVVSGNEREEIREYLKGYTCFTKPKDGYPDTCNGMHAKWQVSQGNCEGAKSAHLINYRGVPIVFLGMPSTSDGAVKKPKGVYKIKNIDLSGMGSCLDKKKKNEMLMGYAVSIPWSN